jgi:hypothetical protein
MWQSSALVFISSACTLVIELIAGRIMAPYVGVSLYTWTSIIGIVLAGMSVGNYLGGVVADRKASRRTLGVIFIAGSIACLLILVITDFVIGQAFRLSLLPRIVVYMTAIFLLFEMTGNYQIIIPIMLTSIIGTVVAGRFCEDSIDTVDFTREGINIHEGREVVIMKSLKGYTAWECNRVLQRKGTFWQAESYDHIVRDAGEFQRVVNYVLNNPVKAGLVKDWRDWKWNYQRQSVPQTTQPAEDFH